MKPEVFLFQHLKLTKREGLNLLLMSPNGKTEEICGNHEKPELATKTRSVVKADNKDIDSAATGKEVLGHCRFPRIG